MSKEQIVFTSYLLFFIVPARNSSAACFLLVHKNMILIHILLYKLHNQVYILIHGLQHLQKVRGPSWF